ncbi:TolB family protein [Nocardioides daejeonensis]|uniref:TolB family protein n=1 Tax=Nocardioides daejeonensis TaxID=1046556 RepID=UPI000D74EE42|nr:PD40 domain-containing protein [Nocardioides daejeonensis]
MQSSLAARSPRPATRTLALAAAAVTGAALLSLPSTSTQAASRAPLTDRISVATGGQHPGSGNNGGGRGTERRLLSDNGRFVVFEGSAPFVRGQVPLNWQIMVRDRKLGTTVAVSRNKSGALANGRSTDPAISANGRWIVFESAATNLVAGDTNGQTDVFRHDTLTGTTTLISRRADGGLATRSSGPASLSANGRYVSFISYAGGLAPGDTDDVSQAYLHDTTTGITELISVKASGIGSSALTSTSVSNDGQRVLFESLDADVAPGAHNLAVDVFLRDRATDTTRMVAGNQAGADRASMSADGRYVVYQSKDPDIDPADTNTRADVFVVDLATDQHTLVSKSSAGVVGDVESKYGGISRDGRYVVFESKSTNLVPGDTNGQADVFRHDLVTGQTVRVSVRGNGAQEPLGGIFPSISGDGHHVVFESYARDLTPHPTGTWRQVFVRDLSGSWPAMVAKVGKLPKQVKKAKKIKVKTSGIGAGEKLTVVWKAKGKTPGKKKITTAVATKGDRITLKTGPKAGKYAVTVRYAGLVLRKQVVRTR